MKLSLFADPAITLALVLAVVITCLYPNHLRLFSVTWDCGGDGGGSDESTDYSGVSPIAYVLITFGAIASCSAAVGQILLISEKVSLNHQLVVRVVRLIACLLHASVPFFVVTNAYSSIISWMNDSVNCSVDVKMVNFIPMNTANLVLALFHLVMLTLLPSEKIEEVLVQIGPDHRLNEQAFATERLPILHS